VAVHLLAADQQDLARRFATSGVDRFAHPGVPLLYHDGRYAHLGGDACDDSPRTPDGHLPPNRPARISTAVLQDPLGLAVTR
jgi:hypothetical protein